MAYPMAGIGYRYLAILTPPLPVSKNNQLYYEEQNLFRYVKVYDQISKME